MSVVPWGVPGIGEHQGRLSQEPAVLPEPPQVVAEVVLCLDAAQCLNAPVAKDRAFVGQALVAPVASESGCRHGGSVGADVWIVEETMSVPSAEFWPNGTNIARAISVPFLRSVPAPPCREKEWGEVQSVVKDQPTPA
jgi:hypothetical protein